MKALAISVIIPTYNEEDHLFDCLQALEHQSVRPKEVFVVDNNSSDNSAAIARRFDFVTLLHESKQGLYHARQTGMNAATGDILCRIDADTIVTKRWCENIAMSFQDTETQALTGPLGYHDFMFPNFSLWLEHMFLVGAKKQGYDFMFGCNMALRKSEWRKIQAGLCNKPFIFEDIDIAIHLKGRSVVPHYSRGMSAFVSARRSLDRPKDFVRYIRGHSRTYQHHGITKRGTKYAEASFILFYLIFRPFVMAFDSNTRRLSWRKLLLNGDQARPDPMDVN